MYSRTWFFFLSCREQKIFKNIFKRKKKNSSVQIKDILFEYLKCYFFLIPSMNLKLKLFFFYYIFYMGELIQRLNIVKNGK